MKYLIYALILLLCVWAVRCLVRSVRRQLRGGCSCGCGGDCPGCKQDR